MIIKGSVFRPIFCVMAMLIIGHLLPPVLNAQVLYDFEREWGDTVIVSVPGRWGIDHENPVRGLGSLHHVFDNPESGADQIAFPLMDLKPEEDTLQWSFRVRYEYTPSSLNHWCFFLTSDGGPTEMHPAGSARGVVVGVNFLGSDDMIKLYSMDGERTEVLLNTGYNWQDSSLISKDVGVVVERSPQGLWVVRLDPGTGSFTEIGRITARELYPITYCGLYYRYSSTKDRMLWFDDLRIEGVFQNDTLPPEIISLSPGRLNCIEVEFDEPVDSATACRPQNYRLDPSGLAPGAVNRLSSTNVKLCFSDPFENNTEHRLWACNIQDIKGNRQEETSAVFDWYLPQAGDIVVNELMIDPLPEVRLPGLEYIELLNTTNRELNLDQYRVYCGNDYTTIQQIRLAAGELLLLVPRGWDTLRYPADNMLFLTPFPRLTNSGQTVAVTDSTAVVLDAVRYGEHWYKDALRREGGWSLERMDPHNLSGDPLNWMYSSDPAGGTPGVANSVSGSFPDRAPPLVQRIYAENDSLFVIFSERIPDEILQKKQMYYLSEFPEWAPIPAYGFPLRDRVCLALGGSPDTATLYSLEFSREFSDFEGNSMQQTTYYFSTPAEADSGDLLITEILYEPSAENPEFMELYNASTGVLDLSEYRLSVLSPGSNPGSPVSLVDQPYQLLPGALCVVTGDTVRLKREYPRCKTGQMIRPGSFPALRNDGGSVFLMRNDLTTLEKAEYQPEMHYPYLTDARGISLERVSLQARGTDFFNWRSSVEVAGASPGFHHTGTDSIPAGTDLLIAPVVFSPDHDGYQDRVEIGFTGELPGSMFHLRVYDLAGNYICRPFFNERILPDGRYFWDGLCGQTLLRPGTYILMMEVLRLDGKHKIYKKAVHLTLGRRR